MYNDNASEVPLYLVPNNDGIGKRLVRRPHPPPTSAPLPDDFDAITETRDSTTVYDDITNSALEIDYDDITVAPIFTLPSTPVYSPTPTPAPVHTSPPRNLTSPPRQRRAGSPSHSLASFSPDVRGSRRGGDSHGAGKAHSVVGGDRDRDRDRTGQRRSLGVGNAPLPPSFPPGKGPAKGRNDLVEKLVIEDGPERTISVWREHVAKRASEPGRGGGGGSANAAGGDGGGGAAGDGTGGDGRSDLDSHHVGRRRVSTDSRRRVESLAQGSAMGSPSLKGKGHRSRESAEFTEISRSILPSTVPARSATPQVATNADPDASSSQPTTPQKSQRRGAPTSPSVGHRPKKPTEYSPSLSDGASTKVASGHEIESVLASCQPSLLHLLPILEELGVRRSEHMTALARMREQTRDREVKEEALRKGITVVEWAILIDKLQSL